ncbi:hypothetical protein [Qipengyuania gaetbuli]|uniref:hypothetical protein n=1 Tax=Qipengyuania gaetbuli TaxID=266952 RepID=UPI001CD7AF85|nr:hypothetical protein [Qipengyuania gaetbuli]MCA0910519.1 hypothetical protein [Qipengyuania gaetbuli]
MNARHLAALAVIATGAVAGPPASAQVAAEEAVILSGSSGQAATQSSLGEAISGSINSATQALRSANSANAGNTSRTGRTGYAGTIPEGDPLENTDAKTYQVQGGARLKLSGSFRPSRTTSCEKNCDTPPADAETPEEPAPKPD